MYFTVILALSGDKMDNLIIWQKWRDPFGEDDEAITEMLDEMFIDDEPNEEREEEISSTISNELIKHKKNIRVMATPMGIIPVTENTASGKLFNFWMGHTNFSITKNIAKIIEDTDGVESLDIYTRYRFRISVGKVFEDSTVMRKINDNIYNFLE